MNSVYSLVIAFLAVVVLPSAEAGSIRVTPTKIELGTDGNAASVKIKNEGSQPTTIQVMAMPWINAEDRSKPVKEILAFPPIVEIPVGGQQVVRLAARGLEAVANEKAYVLHFKEIPDSTQIDGSGLAFVLNVELPLFVKPRAAKPEPVWTLEKTHDGGPVLSLTNLGNAHLRVGSFTLHKLSSGDPLVEEKKAAYALAGEKNTWPLEVAPDVLEETLNLKAETNIGPIETIVSLKGG